MGLMYACQFSSVTVSAIQDLFEILAPTDAIVVIHSINIAQQSDYGDSEAEGLDVQISRATGSGSAGSAGTENPLEVGSPAAGAVVELNNTTQATGTTVLLADSFNVQAGWQYRPTPEERIVISPGGILVVELPVAPTDPVEMSGTIIWEEIGG